ncbi:ATP-binding protein [Pseudobacter ginsenosidimutans]|uniref:histidine kinase n=1 Tax=Pseudobacter ginsenosidimutans TaxID=661488 RepID=A0A4Q7N4Z5_9BACT|nr:ATP-binding protein [Pseudobacter ginsenosidimutans]QEC44581.1 tetratricopeptide repeat protein [Pseudobacter ginsenosidimutans]RZS76060.1 signal transduction histidine kinase [Pseudobacter ginsenosidimutans]
MEAKNPDQDFRIILRRLIFIVVAWCTLQQLTAQTRPDLSQIPAREDKIDAWREYLNELLGYNASGKSDSKLLIQEAKYGLQLCLPNDYRRHSMFFLFTGCAFEKLKQFDSAAYYLEKSVELAKKCDAVNYEITGLSRLNYVYDYILNVGMRKHTLDRMKKIAATSNEPNIKQLTFEALGTYYSDISDYENAIKYKLESIELYKKLLQTDTLITSTRNVGYHLTNLANLYSELGRNEKAIQYLDEARVYVGDIALREGEESLYLGYFRAYLAMEKTDSAAVYYDRIYREMPPGDTLYNVLSTANRLYADYYLKKEDIKNAEHYARLAQSNALISQQVDDQIQANVVLGEVLYKEGKYKQAIQFLRPVMDAPFDFDKFALSNIQNTLARSYAALGQWKDAYHFLDRYSELKDTLQLAAADKNFVEIEGKYQNSQKIQQLKVKDLELSDARKQRLWLTGGIVLLLIIAALALMIYRNKKRTADLLDEKNKALAMLNKDLEQANQTKVKLFSIIGHDLRSPINQVHQFLRLHQMSPELVDQEERNKLSTKIQEATGALLDTMEDLLLWSKTQMEKFNIVPEETELLPIINQCQDLLQLDIESRGIHIDNRVKEGDLVITDAYFLQTIIRNLFQNAIKASPKNGTIQFDFTDNPDQAILTITNEGKGFSQEEYESIINNTGQAVGITGLGLQLVADLAAKLNASIQFRLSSESRTVAEISWKHVKG